MNGLKTDTIINRDALYALRELPEESVHCCVTSPPYAHAARCDDPADLF